MPGFTLEFTFLPAVVHRNVVGIRCLRLSVFFQLWMGSHPKAPATVVGSKDTPFIQYLESYPERCLGKAVVDEFDGKLPFLFKVSV